MAKVSLPKLPIVKIGLVVKSKSEPIRNVVKSKSTNQDQPPVVNCVSSLKRHQNQNYDLCAHMCAACFEATISSYVRLTSTTIGSFPVEQCLTSLV